MSRFALFFTLIASFTLPYGSGLALANCDEALTIAQLRERVVEMTDGLDPNSRYIRELLAIIDESENLTMLNQRLDLSRGSKWAGPDVFSKMSLEEKLRSNLTTSETRLFRFTDVEVRFFRNKLFSDVAQGSRRILSLPSANGLEAISLASWFQKFGYGEVWIDGFDIQAKVIEEARSGDVKILGVSEVHFSNELHSRLSFEVRDVFKDALAENAYDAVFCRNFLPYFTADKVASVLPKLIRSLRPGGYLVVENLSLEKFSPVFARLQKRFRMAKVPAVAIFRMPR